MATDPRKITVRAALCVLSFPDVNEDQKPDLVTANRDSNDISVFLGDGGGGFAAATSIAAGSGASAVLIGDLNGVYT